MTRSLLLLGTLLLTLATAQTPGKTPEKHPKLQTWKCTNKHGCKKQDLAVVIDGLAHPVHQKDNPSLGCGEWGSAPNVTVCPDEKTCAKNCIVEGIKDYAPYGVSTKKDSITLTQFNDAGNVVSPRLYLLNHKGDEYEMLKLTGNEISFDVDMAKLPCGMNGALYLSEMNKSGGRSKLNPGGATYGSGYCDAQCFKLPFINGVGNIAAQGACCNEMDLWEANRAAQALTPHTCSEDSIYKCTGDECTFDGVCDQWGCTYNPYGLGYKDYYGPGLTVDTLRPFTVVTQFPAEGGVLKEIRRLYVQDKKVIQNVKVSANSTEDSISADFCASSPSRYVELGGMEGMGGALSRGMVLIFSIWWDTTGFMNWLDTGSTGPCNTTEGDPAVIVKVEPDPSVTWSNIRYGEIGSTYKH